MEICTECGRIGGGHESTCDKSHKHSYKMITWLIDTSVYVFVCAYCGKACGIIRAKFWNTERVIFVDERTSDCVEKWPESVDGDYDPRCCRFPKSCSAGYQGLRKA